MGYLDCLKGEDEFSPKLDGVVMKITGQVRFYCFGDKKQRWRTLL